MLETGPLVEVGLVRFSLVEGDLCTVRGRAGAMETTGRGPMAGCCIATAVMAGQLAWKGGDKAMRDYGPLARLRIRMQVSCYRSRVCGRSYRVGDGEVTLDIGLCQEQQIYLGNAAEGGR